MLILMKRGIHLLRFCAKLYKMQLDQGMYFLHENPPGSESWLDPTINKLVNDQRVIKISGEVRVSKLIKRPTKEEKQSADQQAS